jgi:hypothetical protein
MDKCKVCSLEFKRKYPRGGQRKIYCSKKCRYADAYVEKICKTCNKKFIKNVLSTRSDAYCSLACIQRYPCQLCGKIITGRVSFQSRKKRYCTKACASFVNRTLNSKMRYMPNGFARSIRKHGKIMCDICGIDDVQVLCVHHIDGNRLNNSMDNLQTLCCNCHHRIHFGRGNNRLKCVQLARMIAHHNNRLMDGVLSQQEEQS